MSSRRNGKIVAEWWQELADPKNPRKRGAARAALAHLRRARTPTDALLEPATADLARRLGIAPLENRLKVGRLIERVGVVTAVLAHVREDDPIPVARACGPTTENDGKLKYGRFRRLLQAQDDELIDQMRRLVQLLGGKVNVADLAQSLLFWNDDVRKRWALQYFGADSTAEKSASPPAASISADAPTP